MKEWHEEDMRVGGDMKVGGKWHERGMRGGGGSEREWKVAWGKYEDD